MLFGLIPVFFCVVFSFFVGLFSYVGLKLARFVLPFQARYWACEFFFRCIAASSLPFCFGGVLVALCPVLPVSLHPWCGYLCFPESVALPLFSCCYFCSPIVDVNVVHFVLVGP